MRPRPLLLAILFAGAAWLGQPAQSDAAIFTVSDKNDGDKILAKAVITTGAGTITIDLYNELGFADFKSRGQMISGLQFTTTNPDTSLLGATSLTTATGNLVDITGKTPGIVDDFDGPGAAPLTHWALNEADKVPEPNVTTLTGAHPFELIAPKANGSNEYPNSNSSVSDSGAQPSVLYSAHFVLSAANVTSATTITSFVFMFGTDGDPFPGTPPPEDPTAPEPASLALAAVGLFGLVAARKRKQAKAAA
jgi:hypothetical protein